VPVIVLSVLLVGLVAAAIIFGLKAADLEDQLKASQQETDAAKAARRADLEKITGYTQLIGWQDLENVSERYHELKAALQAKDENRPLPSPYGQDRPEGAFDTVVGLLEGYADRCFHQEKLVDARTRERDSALAEVKEKTGEIERTRATIQEQVDAEKARAEKIQGEKEQIQTQLEGTITQLKADVEKQKGEITKLTGDLNNVRAELEKQQKSNQTLMGQIKDLKNPKANTTPIVGPSAKELVDGKIIRVEPDGSHVMIDLGREDWVGMGMVFQVYDRADPETRSLKGRIQIRRLMDTIAQCKVLEQDKMDPILPGMFILNPAFKRGRTVEFVIVGRTLEPNLKRLLQRYPCKVTEDLSNTTDYVIRGEAPLRKDDITPEDDPKWAEAKERGITAMRETDLLRYLGEERD